MSAYVLPAIYVVFVWWFTTGVLLLLDRLAPHTFRWSMLAATAIGAGAVLMLAASRADATPAGAYVAFTAAVLIWGWQELGFLTGFITGPRKHGCPEGCGGWRHLVHAIEAILYHELALIAAGALVLAVTWDASNRVGLWTFVVLWMMRQSAKLNLFLGVRNLGEEYLPDHLRYLSSFFRRRSVNLLFPVSVTIASIAVFVIATQSARAGTGESEVAGLVMIATLLALAVLEHWFMVLPLPSSALWNWGLRPNSRSGAPPPRAVQCEPVQADDPAPAMVVATLRGRS